MMEYGWRNCLLHYRNHMIILVLLCGSTAIDLSQCGKNKGCFTVPSACYTDVKIRCVTIFTYEKNGEYLTMELYSVVDNVESSFVAIGFSADRAMGNDAVTDCSIFPGLPLQGRLSYNLRTTNYRIADDEISTRYLRTISVQKANDSIYCMLHQKIVPVGESLAPPKVLPLSKPYFLLLAKGRTHGKGLFYHSYDYGKDFPVRSKETVDLLQFPLSSQRNAAEANKNHIYYLSLTAFVHLYLLR